MFRLLSCNIREHHFSTERDISTAATAVLKRVKLTQMHGAPSIFGPVYEVGHFVKQV
jgi:hypothetical protein